jgi:ABC-type phosphate transport system permease subunit
MNPNPYPYQPRQLNQTLAIVSLVTGILGIVACVGLTGPVALITGIMAKKKISQNPAEYGGDGLALAGIITGIIGTVILLFVALYFVFVIGIVGLSILNS